MYKQSPTTDAQFLENPELQVSCPPYWLISRCNYLFHIQDYKHIIINSHNKLQIKKSISKHQSKIKRRGAKACQIDPRKLRHLKTFHHFPTQITRENLHYNHTKITPLSPSVLPFGRATTSSQHSCHEPKNSQERARTETKAVLLLVQACSHKCA